MKSFQDLRVMALGFAVSIIVIAAILNCGGGSDNSTPPGVVSLSVAADGSCTPRLEKDLTQYLASCTDYRGEQDHKIEKLKKLANDCNQFTQTHGEAVVCNLTHLPDLENRDVRDCLKLSDDQAASNGVLILKVKGLHEYCGEVVSEYSNQVQQGPPPGFSNGNDPDRPHRSHKSDEDD